MDKNNKETDIEERPEELFDGFDFYEESVLKGIKKVLEECIKLTRKKRLTLKEKERMHELTLEIVMIKGLERGFWVENLSYRKYSTSLGSMRLSLIKEYECKTSLEFMLVDRIVASYWRSMQCDRTFNLILTNENDGFSFDQLKVNVIKELNKSIEFSNRQLSANIIMLKELKQPKLNIKVNTKSAFIGQNQQFNLDNNEIVKPK